VSRTGCEFTSCSANRVDEPLNWRRSDEDGQTRDENGVRPALSLQAFENRRFGSHRYAERTAIFAFRFLQNRQSAIGQSCLKQEAGNPCI